MPIFRFAACVTTEETTREEWEIEAETEGEAREIIKNKYENDPDFANEVQESRMEYNDCATVFQLLKPREEG